MGFKIELYDDVSFSWIMHGLKNKSDKDKRFDISFRNSLNAHKHWQILDFFDGTKSRSKEARKQIQWNTLKDFCEEEIQKYYNAAVNMAISGNPYPGYDVLFENVAGDKDSMFYDSVTPELQVKINNGRFWENLNELNLSLNYGRAYHKMEDILINHFEDINIKNVPKDIGKVWISYLGGGNWESRGSGLSQRAVGQYSKLLEKIDNNLVNLGINEKDFSRMVVPYIETLVGVDCDKNPLMDDFEERLKSPLVEKYKAYLKKA